MRMGRNILRSLPTLSTNTESLIRCRQPAIDQQPQRLRGAFTEQAVVR
jgi:hypothetical protein